MKHLDSEEEGEGEGAEDDEDAGDGEKKWAETRALLTGGCNRRLLDWVHLAFSGRSWIPLELVFILSDFLCCNKSSNISGLSVSVLVITMKHFARQASLLTHNNWVASQ